MKNILIACFPDPNRSPRPNRMIHCLKSECQLHVFGMKKINLDGVVSYSFSHSHLSDTFSQPKAAHAQLMRYLMRILFILYPSFGRFIFPFFKQVQHNINALKEIHFDLIISHDLHLLPFLFSIKDNSTKILFDAREYYPKESEDSLLWNLTIKPFNLLLCQNYLQRVDKILTVSDGLAQQYQQEYGVLPEVFMSLPPFHHLQPKPVNPHQIRIIHHGDASPDRRSEKMIEMMDYVDQRFSLDLMLIPSSNTSYWQKLIRMVEQRNNVRIIPPVKFYEIIPFIHQYDIGLYLCPPTNFNTTYMLPNKFFEFIQARLAVAIGPSIEMKKIVEQYHCGIVSDDFEPKTMAMTLNSLSAEQIEAYKQHAHFATSQLNAEVNCRRMKEIIKELIG